MSSALYADFQPATGGFEKRRFGHLREVARGFGFFDSDSTRPYTCTMSVSMLPVTGLTGLLRLVCWGELALFIV